MKLFIDNKLPAPEGWTLVTNYEDAITTVMMESVTAISFAHDLGAGATGTDIAKFIEHAANDHTLPPITWGVHRANPAGRAEIIWAMMGADRAWNPPTPAPVAE